MSLPACTARLLDGSLVVACDTARGADARLALAPRLLPGILVGEDGLAAGLMGWSAVKAMQGGAPLRVWTRGGPVRQFRLVPSGDSWSWAHADRVLGVLDRLPIRGLLGEDMWAVLEALPPLDVAHVSPFSPVR